MRKRCVVVRRGGKQMSIAAYRPLGRRVSLLALPADVVSLIGVAAVVFSALYLLSDVIELLQGGFSTTQLVLTYISEASIPLFVIGIYAAQRPRIGRLGLVGAVGYAYTFVFFTGTVVLDRKSTRLNSSHRCISYAVFCLKK